MPRDESDTDGWYTEPWTSWRTAEMMARMLVAGLSSILMATVALWIAIETALVSKEFVGMLGWLAFSTATLDRSIPDT